MIMNNYAVVLFINLFICLKLSCIADAEISLDFRPLSVTREWNLRQPSGPEKLPILDFIELVHRHGYPAEEHQLKTVDGYKLRFHRIPGSPSRPKAPGKPVVYIQHGLLSSSDTFVLSGPGKDLAFILADAGYDVWLGNGRGNTYSRSHVKISPNNKKFWEFSFHEIAMYDVPAMIDYVLQMTNQKSVIYVAHSMGTTISFILLSSKPEYNKKISVVINMATIGNWKKPRNIMKFFSIYGYHVKAVIDGLGLVEMFPQSLALGSLFNLICRDGSVFQPICVAMTHFICGYDPDLLDTRLLAEGLAYFPAGTSAHTLSHYHQNIVSGKLQMFDYGPIKNYALYKQFSPPGYNLQKVLVPVIMIYGKGDAIASPEDSIDLAKILPNAKAETVAHDKFNHLDFVWAKNATALLYNRVFEIIQRSAKTRRIEEL